MAKLVTVGETGVVSIASYCVLNITEPTPRYNTLDVSNYDYPSSHGQESQISDKYNMDANVVENSEDTG